MQYKTISMEMLRQHTKLHDQLRREQRLLAVLNSIADLLKSRHESWQMTLSRTKPELDASTRASAALEIAIQEIEKRLPLAFPPDGQDRYTLDAGMAYMRSLTSHD